MHDLSIRSATAADIEALIEMRRDASFEGVEPSERMSRPGYEAECAAFLADAISTGRWHIWVR